jgi:hypothetical protein
MVRCSFWMVGVLALGCGASSESISEDAFLEDFPSSYCALQERCYPERFADLYNNDVDACLESLREPFERRLDDGSCDFDETRAASCLDWVEGLDCASWTLDEDETCDTQTICGE